MFDLPEGFTRECSQVPSHRRPVEICRLAFTGPNKFETMNATYNPEYAVGQWRDANNVAVSDTGGNVLGWREIVS